jgi:hypothetical protein
MRFYDNCPEDILPYETYSDFLPLRHFLYVYFPTDKFVSGTIAQKKFTRKYIMSEDIFMQLYFPG